MYTLFTLLCATLMKKKKSRVSNNEGKSFLNMYSETWILRQMSVEDNNRKKSRVTKVNNRKNSRVIKIVWI